MSRSSKENVSYRLPKAGETFVDDSGTVSEVLDDTVDDNYEPTQEEIKEYAEWIGMKLPEDNDLLWIAREGLVTPLPKEWKPCKVNINGNDEVYFFNFKTSDKSWDHPLDETFKAKYRAEKEKVRKGGRRDSNAAGKHSSQVLNTSTDTAPYPTASSPHRLNSITSPSHNTSGMGGSLFNTSQTNNSSLHNDTPLLSEAERALEERIREEVRAQMAEERQKEEQLFESKLQTARQLYEADMEELRVADEKRRNSFKETMEATHQKQLAEVKKKCDDQYRTQFNDLSTREEELRTQVSKLDAEHQRSSNNTEVEEVEKEAEKELGKALRQVEAEVLSLRQKRQEELQSEYKRQMSSQPPSPFSPTKGLTQAEKDAISQFNKKMRALGEEKESLEKQIKESEGQSKSGDVLREITNQKEAQLKQLQTEHEKEMEKLKKEKDAVIANLQKQLCEADGPMPVSVGTNSPQNSPGKTSGGKVPLRTSSGPIKSTGIKTPASAPLSTPSTSPSFPKMLTDLKIKYEREKQIGIAELKKQREELLANASVPSTPTGKPVSSTPSSTAIHTKRQAPVSTNPRIQEMIQEMKAEHATQINQKADFYKDLEENLKEGLSKELEIDTKDTDKLVEAALQSDMELYKKEVSSRRERMQLEHDQKVNKLIKENEIARQVHEKKKAEMEVRKLHEIEEAKVEMLEDAVEEALSKERTKLEAAKKEVVERKRKNYEAEKDAIKAEVDEEMGAYEKAENVKTDKEVMSLASSAVNTPVQSAASPLAIKDNALQNEIVRNEIKTLEKQLSADRFKFSSEHAKLQQTLAEVQKKAQQHHEAVTKAEAAIAAQKAQSFSTPPPEEEEETDSEEDNDSQAASTAASTAASIANATHTARLTVLEEVYKEQESELLTELRRWQDKNESLTTQGRTAVSNTPEPQEEDQTLYWQSELSGMQQRQQSLQAAKEAWAGQQSMLQPPSPQQQQQQQAFPNSYVFPVSPSNSSAPPPQASRLTEVVCALSDRLDALTSEIVDQRRQQHADPNSGSSRRRSTSRRGIGQSVGSKWNSILNEYDNSTY